MGTKYKCGECNNELTKESPYCLVCGANNKIIDLQNGLNENKTFDLDPSMLDKYIEINQKLRKMEDAEDIFESHEKHLNALQEEFAEIKKEVRKAKNSLDREFNDIERLNSLTWTALKAKIKGEHEELLTKEEQEFMKAKSHLDLATREYEEIKMKTEKSQEQSKISKQVLQHKKQLEDDLRVIIDQIGEDINNPEEDQLESEVNEITQNLMELSKKIRMIQHSNGYISTAISLYNQAKSKLSSAKNYSDWDTFLGGGAFVDSMKRSRVGDANSLVLRANRELQRGVRQLDFLNTSPSANVEQSSYWTDTFFDGLWGDLDARNKIKRSMESVDSALMTAVKMKQKVDYELAILHKEYNKREKSLSLLKANLQEVRVKLIENYMEKNGPRGI